MEWHNVRHLVSRMRSTFGPDNHINERGSGGSPPENFWNFGLKWCDFVALYTNLPGAKLTFLKDWKLPGARNFWPGAKPVCQVPNLALGTHFRNTARTMPQREPSYASCEGLRGCVGVHNILSWPPLVPLNTFVIFHKIHLKTYISWFLMCRRINKSWWNLASCIAPILNLGNGSSENSHLMVLGSNLQYTFPSHCWAKLSGFNKFPVFLLGDLYSTSKRALEKSSSNIFNTIPILGSFFTPNVFWPLDLRHPYVT